MHASNGRRGPQVGNDRYLESAADFLRGDRVNRTIEDRLQDAIHSLGSNSGSGSISGTTSISASVRGSGQFGTGIGGGQPRPGDAIVDRDLEDAEAREEEHLLRRARSREPSVIARSVRGSRSREHGSREQSVSGAGSAAVSVAMAF